ncbi:hypothetical protein Hanom_Chr16g01484001 [Helianthus anomalus]
MDFSESHRNKYAACYRQLNKKEHLVEHMRISYICAHSFILYRKQTQLIRCKIH